MIKARPIYTEGINPKSRYEDKRAMHNKMSRIFVNDYNSCSIAPEDTGHLLTTLI